MYLKVKRDSETGVKLNAIVVKIADCKSAISVLSKKYGFKRWRCGYFNAYGGISAVLFNESDDEPNINPDDSIWKQTQGGYFPKRNNTKGKEIYNDFENLHFVSVKELNDAISYKSVFNHPAIFTNNVDYFGIQANDKDNYIPPTDCIDIAYSEFKELFKIAKPD